MVARPAAPQRSCNAGEFTPEAKGRVDIKQYYSAGLAFKGIEPVPQSGFRAMGGTWRVGDWRKPLAVRAITSPTPAAGPFTGTQTIWTGTVAGSVAAVLAAGLAISAGTATFTIEAFVGGVWVAIGGPFAVKTGTPETRLAAFAPGQQKTATSLRILATFSTAGTTLSGLTVSAFFESGSAERPRYVELTTDAGDALSCFVTAGIADFFTEGGFVGSARLATVTAAMLPDLAFYSEGNTIGIFHGDLETVRLFLVTAGQLQDWRQDLWPYDPVPTADLGGIYPKIDDKWELFFRWNGENFVFLSVTVNGETTPALPLSHAGAPATADPYVLADWVALAASLQTALEALPSLGATITVTPTDPAGGRNFKFTITFGGALSGDEYDVSALVVNTAEASVLPYHIQVGKTDLEDLFSASNGWPGGAELVQDRIGYYRIPAVGGAMALSKVAEYFDLNVEGTTDNAARLDKLRSQTSETILHIKESTYLFVFTDKAMYFVPNRTIERNTPLNFVPASEIGAQPNCRPFVLEGEVYYVAINPEGLSFAAGGGKQVLRITEAVTSATTNFNADPVSLLASHLVENIIRSANQKPQSDLDASKGWLMRTDGRLIACQMIRNQDINGYCEWLAAAGGLVREIGIDGKNRLWMANERTGRMSIERYDTALFLQDAVSAVPDLAGVITGLPYEDGAELWAKADGYVLGPFTCASGSIGLGDAYAAATVGRWIAPRFESMPQVLVTGNDEVILRPGRIHTLHVDIADTGSIAVGANGEDPQDVVLNETTDPVDTPMPLKTKTLTVGTLLGMMEGTTAVITQKRPGPLRVRQIAMGTKL